MIILRTLHLTTLIRNLFYPVTVASLSTNRIKQFLFLHHSLHQLNFLAIQKIRIIRRRHKNGNTVWKKNRSLFQNQRKKYVPVRRLLGSFFSSHIPQPWQPGMGPAPYELVLLNMPMGPVNISWGWVSEKNTNEGVLLCCRSFGLKKVHQGFQREPTRTPFFSCGLLWGHLAVTLLIGGHGLGQNAKRRS